MTRAHARRTDPAESHQAAVRVENRVTDLELRVLAALVLRGPATTAELAEYMELSLVTVSPRMAPLERRGMVSRVGRRDRRALWNVEPRAMLAIQ
jgi:DNA-binding MarR family transcriptional regulator